MGAKSAKMKNLEWEFQQIGLRYWRVGYRDKYSSNSKWYETATYVLLPSAQEDAVDFDVRRKLACHADQSGMYVKFAALDVFPALVNEFARTGQSLPGTSVVATFFGKFPCSRTKKTMREIKMQVKESFEYMQEDPDCLNKLMAADKLEKEVLSITRVDKMYWVYAGVESEHPLISVAALIEECLPLFSFERLDKRFRDLDALSAFGDLNLHVPNISLYP